MDGAVKDLLSERGETLEQRLDRIAREARSFDEVMDLTVDLLCERGERLGPDHRVTCLRILEEIMGNATRATLRDCALRLAVLDFVPADLVRAMAGHPGRDVDPRPLALAEAVAPMRPEPPQRHAARSAELRALAARERLDESLSDLVVSSGDEEAMAICAANRSARLSRPAMSALVAGAGENETLRKALITRSDIPDDLVPQVWNGADEASRARLLRAGFSSEPGMRPPQHPPTDPGPGSRSEQPPSSSPEPETGVPRDDMIADIILEYSKPISLAHAARQLAERAGLEEGVAFDLLCGSYERGVIVLARAADLDEWTFLQLVCTRMKLAGGTGAPHRALRDFRKCGRAEALSVLDALGRQKNSRS